MMWKYSTTIGKGVIILLWETWEGKSKRFIGNAKPTEGRKVWTFDQRFEDAIQAPRRREGMEGMDARRASCSFRDDKGYACFQTR